MVIVFIGPPGSGKGTQANILKNHYIDDLEIITVSDLLKNKSLDGSDLGVSIKNKMDKGELISDEVVISVLNEKLLHISGKNILIDGYPRSKEQATALLEFFKENKDLKVINFQVKDDKLLERIKKRSLEESRADDAFFQKRLDIFKKNNTDIISELKHSINVINISADEDIPVITRKIIDNLGLN